MRLTCPHCKADWEFADRRLLFCPFCGKGLPAEADTQSFPVAVGSEAATLGDEAARLANDRGDPAAVGGYRLLRVLGVGGMGKVYEAEESATGRRVALKLVSADYAESADGVERFRQEGRLASMIAHPRCVFVLAADEDAGRPYIVMELMAGDNLDDFVRTHGPLPPKKAVAMALDIIEGLQEAHRVGVVHRDVKPSNCFLSADGRLKVGDFGLAKSLIHGSHLTRTGSFLGTPLFASPEQVRGDPIDAQSDLYSTAATLYYMLTGRAPFQSDNAAVTLARIAADPAPSMRTLRTELPPELDAAVLRGLERDRKRRWQNLDQFAEALRPFLAGPLSMANIGRRMGAFVVDYAVILAVGFLLMPLEVALGWDPTNQTAAYDWRVSIFRAGIWLLYFSVTEGLWSRSLGKWLLDLRVRDAVTGGDPPFKRVVARTLVFYFLPHLGGIVAAILFPMFEIPSQMMPREMLAHFWVITALACLSLGGLIVGTVALVSTMRRRNGYRGLHEFASGTRTELVSQGTRTWAPPNIPSSLTLSRLAGLPERVGPFRIQGAFRWDEGAKILLGVDEALGRPVILQFRTAGAGPLPAYRRDVERTTRLRWLAAGQQDDYVWDSFLAPSGCSLPALIAAQGRMTWTRFQPLLMRLTDELHCAVEETSLPASLRPELVWLRNDGRLVLLDFPLSELEPAFTDKQIIAQNDYEIPEKRAMALLGQVVVLALEGRQVSPSALPSRVRVPLPLPVRTALSKLLAFDGTLRAFNDSLGALKNVPTEVTRGRRAGQLVLMALFQLIVLGFCLSPFWCAMRLAVRLASYAQDTGLSESSMARLDDASLSDFLCDGLNTHPLPRLRAVAQLEADADLRSQLQQFKQMRQAKADAWIRRGGIFFQQVPANFDKVFETHRQKRWQSNEPGDRTSTPREFRTFANRAANNLATNQNSVEPSRFLFWADLVTSCAGPLLWVLWAFIMRGGLSYRITGIFVVRSDGRVAERFRCLVRALLVWAPLAALLTMSYWVDDWYWQLWDNNAAPSWMPWLSTCLWWSAWLFCAASAALAVRSPTQSLHDRLAGTYLVPTR